MRYAIDRRIAALIQGQAHDSDDATQETHIPYAPPTYLRVAWWVLLLNLQLNSWSYDRVDYFLTTLHRCYHDGHSRPPVSSG